MTDNGSADNGSQDNDVQLTQRQARRAARQAKSRAKDERYEKRHARKRSKDVQFLHGHHVIDSESLAEAFPEPETAEYASGTVRRRVTHGVVLVVLLALVVAGVVLAGMIQRGELVVHFSGSRPTAAAETCPQGPFDYPANKSITVNVYNAGRQEGLAGKVAAELKKRGYKVKAVANGSTAYDAPVVVVAGTAGRTAAFNLQRNVAGADFVQDDRKSATVDFIVTGNYKGMVAAKKVDQTPGALSCPRLSPSPKATPKATAKATAKVG